MKAKNWNLCSHFECLNVSRIYPNDLIIWFCSFLVLAKFTVQQSKVEPETHIFWICSYCLFKTILNLTSICLFTALAKQCKYVESRSQSYSASNRLQVRARIAMIVCLLAIGTYPGRIPWRREFYTSCQCSSWNKSCLSVLVHASAWWFCTYQSLGHFHKEQWTWNLIKPWGIAYTRHQSLGIKLGTY